MKYISGGKHQLIEDESFQTEIHPTDDIITRFVELKKDGTLTLKEGFFWDGASGPTIAPPSTVALPAKNLVMESKMILAPSSSGRCKAAVAVVLSTISGTPREWATSATAAMSVTKRVGLLGVSTHTNLVLLSIS